MWHQTYHEIGRYTWPWRILSCLLIKESHSGEISAQVRWLLTVWHFWQSSCSMFEYVKKNVSGIIDLIFTDHEVKSVDMCKPKSDRRVWTLDRWNWDGQFYWNISNCWSVLHNITEEQRTRLHYGRNLISSMLLLDNFCGQKEEHFDESQW